MSQLSSKLPTAARLLLGLSFFVFGLNGFFQFLPMPPPPASALGFISGMASAGYFFPLLKATEVVAAVLLLSNRFVPLALAVLAPILINIVAFHAFLEPASTLVLPLILLGLELYLARSYRESFAPMLRAQNVPHRAPPASGRVAVPAHAG